MKKIIVLMSITGAVCANEISPEMNCCEPAIHSSYSYLDLGVGPIPLPALTVGAGRRTVIGEKTALDLGVECNIFFFINSLKGYANHLWYFNQKPYSQFYIGLGGTLGGVMYLFGYYGCGLQGYAAPNVILGKEFLNCKGKKRFFQIETMYPIYTFRKFENIGGVTIKYGFAF